MPWQCVCGCGCVWVCVCGVCVWGVCVGVCVCGCVCVGGCVGGCGGRQIYELVWLRSYNNGRPKLSLSRKMPDHLSFHL